MTGTTTQPQQPPSAPDRGAARVGFVRRLWTGRARLWQAFWLVGVVGFLVAAAASAAVGVTLFRFTRNEWIVSGIPALVFVPYLAFSLTAVWRCAPNTANGQWSALARMWTVLWPLYLVVKAIRAI